jgi:AAA domain-containing protein
MAFDRINISALIPPAAFYDSRWRIVYSAAVELRKTGTPVCAESVSDYIAFLELEEQFARALDPSKTIDWRKWPEFTDTSMAFSSGRVLEYCLCELRGLYSKRQAAAIGEQLHDGIVPLPEAIASLQSVNLANLNGSIPHALLSFADAAPDPEATLLGNRFLCRQGGMLFVGPSGIGKTAASVQQDLLWSIGRSAFGIRPARPLKILTIQAEDDDGDLSEIVAGIKSHLELSQAELALCLKNCFYVSEKAATGTTFLEKIVAPLLAKLHPDLLRINPLQAYLGGDIKDTELTALWLRNTLNPLLVTYHCAVIIVHHTPKTQFRNTEEWKASDWMYAGAGAADITNWARAALIIDPTEDSKMYRFIAAKRGSRIGWANDFGDSVAIRHFSHSQSKDIFWRDVEETEVPLQSRQANGQFQAQFTGDDILKFMSAIDAEATDAIRSAVSKEIGMSKATFFRLWNHLKSNQKISPQANKWIRS